MYERMLQERLDGASAKEIAARYGEPYGRVVYMTNKLYRKQLKDDAYANEAASKRPVDLDIRLVGLKARALNTLLNEGAKTLGDVAALLPVLKKTSHPTWNFGKRSIAEIEAVLVRHGLLETST